jgi:hypothetical protein
VPGDVARRWPLSNAADAPAELRHRVELPQPFGRGAPEIRGEERQIEAVVGRTPDRISARAGRAAPASRRVCRPQA